MKLFQTAVTPFSAAIVSYNGVQAPVVSTLPTSADFYGLWSTSGAAVAVGSSGVLAKQSGASWNVSTLGAAGGRTLRAVYGTSVSNLWIVGDSGLILRFNGSTATAVASGVSDTLHGIIGSSASSLWAVGDHGRILRSDGNSWSVDVSGSAITTNALYAAAVKNDGTVYVVGDNGVLLRYSGQAWKALDSGTVAPLRAVSVTSSGDVVFAGQGGSILRLRASQ